MRNDFDDRFLKDVDWGRLDWLIVGRFESSHRIRHPPGNLR